MSDLNERLAQEAAELINGGEWRDGKWYSDGHRDAWRKALKPAADRIEKLEAALQKIIDRAEFKNSEYVTDIVCRIAREALEGKNE